MKKEKLKHVSSVAGFTLIEVLASLVILAILLTGVLLAYRQTVSSIGSEFLQERALEVAQRHMELLIAYPQEPNSINLPERDDLDSRFSWQLDLSRIPVGQPRKDDPYAHTAIQATVKVRYNDQDQERAPLAQLVRLFGTNGIKPISGHAVAVPLTREYEEPQWYLELMAQLGREPTFDEILQKMVTTGDLPQEFLEELDLNEQTDPTENVDIDGLDEWIEENDNEP